MSILQRFFKDTLIYGIAAVLPKAINVLLVKLHTSTLSPSEYSVNTSFYVWAAYFNVLLTYGMETSFFRFFNTEKEKGKVVATSFVSILTTSIIALTICLMFSQDIASLLGFSKPIYFKLLVWITILDTLVVIPFAFLRVNGKSKSYTLFRVLNICIYAFFNLFFLWFLPQKTGERNSFYEKITVENFNEGYIFTANLIASLITFLTVLPIVIKIKLRFSFHLLQKMLKYAIPILVAGLAYTTNENLDKLLLENWLGKAVMGTYAGAYKIGVIMSLFILAFRLGAEPFFFNQADKSNAPTIYAIILKWFVIIGCLFVLSIVGYIDLIAKIFLGNDSYLKALAIVPIILMANLFLGIYNNLSIWYKLTDKTKYGMYISVFGAITTILLLYLLIPSIGYMGAAWTTVIAYGSMFAISYFLGQKHYPVPYDMKRILLYVFLTSGIIYISFTKLKGAYLYNTLLIVAFIGFVCLLEKKDIKRLLKIP